MQLFKLSFNRNNLPKLKKQIKEYQLEQLTRNATIKLLKEFDKYFLSFISHRKLRDSVILNIFYEILLKQVDINNKNVDKLKLTEFSSSLDSNTIFPIDQKEEVIHIEKSIEILKTYYYFFQHSLSKNNIINEHMPDIKAKMRKIENINDNTFISRITTSSVLKKQIISKLEPVKTNKSIKVNKTLLEKINSNFYKPQ